MALLTLDPIGIIHTSFRVKFDAPHQPIKEDNETNVVELYRDRGFEHALRDIHTFDKIWLICWFHKNTSWRSLVLPPRGEEKRRGVFATRSPHRPNPIGITAVSLLKVSGLKLYVGSTDLLDGTPILDIKPYLRHVDAFPDASSGWVEEIEEELNTPPTHVVSMSLLAKEQIDWLKHNFDIDFFSKARMVLERDPKPHRTRRITKCHNGQFRMGCGAWRVFYTISENEVRVERIDHGYPKKLLLSSEYSDIPDRDAQISFGEKWEK